MPRSEAQTRFDAFQSNVNRIELDMRGVVTNAGSKSSAYSQMWTAGLAVAAILVSFGIGIYNTTHSAINPILGIDSKRVDDLVNRIDSVSRRVDVLHPN
jgi:predicted metallopeptidase